MSKPIDVTDADFEEQVIKSELPVLVDFWAPWCSPCKMIAPVIEKIAESYSGKIKTVKVDVDSSAQTASKMGIRSIPTIIIFKNGEIAEQLVGMVSEAQLKQLVDKISA
ncbi:MAG: thioredoxin [Candidatus Goldiibacteriota bacterium]